jgi:hypothetical protein|tara:strand:+ start:37 stop:1122 length:1086 start_codon:yes stop_codon:yes gene_type:complete
MATDKKINYEMQGNEKPARNYLGKQKTVTVPVKWQSNPKSPKTELAYITKAEKDLLIKKDIHGSLKKGPNTGPSGIMSLDSQGDYTRDRSQDKARSEMSRGDSERAVRNEARLKEVLTGQVDRGQTSRVSDRVREGAVPEYAYGPDGQLKYIGSGSQYVGKSLFNPSGYRKIRNTRGGFLGFGGQKDIRFNPVTRRYEFEEEETGDVQPGFGGRFFGGLMSLLTGIPVVGSAIGTAYDYGKGIFGNKPRDMSEFNKLSLTLPENQKTYIPEGSDIPMESLALANMYPSGSSMNITSANNNVNTKKGIPYTNQFTTSGNTYPVNQNFTDTMTTYTDAIEQGKNIGDDEQMYIDNQIFNQRFP